MEWYSFWTTSYIFFATKKSFYLFALWVSHAYDWKPLDPCKKPPPPYCVSWADSTLIPPAGFGNYPLIHSWQHSDDTNSKWNPLNCLLKYTQLLTHSFQEALLASRPRDPPSVRRRCSAMWMVGDMNDFTIPLLAEFAVRDKVNHFYLPRRRCGSTARELNWARF